MALHRNSNENNKHDPKGFTSASNMQKLIRDENGISKYVPNSVLPAAINFVDGNIAPPTEVLNAVYVIIDTGGGSVHADWDGLNYNDWARFNSSNVWSGYTPINGDICYDATDFSYKKYKSPDWGALVIAENVANTNLTQTDQFRKYTLNVDNPSYLEFQAGSGSDAIRLTDGLDLYLQNSTSDPITTYFTKMDQSGIQFGSGNWTIRHNGPSQFYIQGAGSYNGKMGLNTGAYLQAPDANRAVELGGHFIKFKDRTLGVEHARFDQNGNFMFNATALIGSEGFLVADDTLVKGSDTSLSTTGFKFTDSADVNLFEIRNNGDIYTETLQGLNVTLDPTAITSMTFTNGILTAQS